MLINKENKYMTHYINIPSDRGACAISLKPISHFMSNNFRTFIYELQPLKKK